MKTLCCRQKASKGLIYPPGIPALHEKILETIPPAYYAKMAKYSRHALDGMVPIPVVYHLVNSTTANLTGISSLATIRGHWQDHVNLQC